MAQDRIIREKAQKYQESGNEVDAERLYKILIKQKPEACDIANLGALLRKQERIEEAIQLYQQWEQQFAKEKGLTLNSVNCAIQASEIRLAKKWLKNGLRVHPDDKDLLNAQARLWQVEGKGEIAIQLLEKLTTEENANIRDLESLGIAYYVNDDYGRAAEIFTKVRERWPGNIRNKVNLITALQKAEKTKDMRKVITNLTDADKESSLIQGAIAFVEMKEGRVYEAAIKFSKLCEIEPNISRHWLNLCACLRELKYGMKALQLAKKAIQIHPTDTELKKTLSQCLAESGKSGPAIKAVQEILSDNKALETQFMYNIQYIGEGYQAIESGVLKRIALQWEEEQKDKAIYEMWRDHIQEDVGKRKLRIGYMSADFCNHPVGRFILPILKTHDKSVVNIIGLSCGKRKDNKTQEIRWNCDSWIEINESMAINEARRICDLQLDILVELGGYTAKSRLDILCNKPAPIQLSYLGYFAPTYLKCIDGWIGDEQLFSKLNAEQKSAHKLLKVKGGYMAYEDESLPKPNRDREKEFCFGCFNHSRKLSKETIALFTKVMKELPNAKLVLKSISFAEEAERKRIEEIFTKSGLSKEKLKILPWIEGRTKHLECYNLIDVALDPYPYGGATTTCEALGMGVPVVSLSSKGMIGQLSASILSSSACSEWIAESIEEYVIIAKKLANNGKRNKHQREKLKEKIYASDISKGRRVSKELERIYIAELDIFKKAASR